MPYAGGDGIDITLPAAANFSSYQYRFMTVDSNGRGTIATAYTAKPIGILQNKPDAADKPANIRVAGIAKLEFGAAADEGALLAANGEGYGTTTTLDTAHYGAIALHAAGGSGDIQDVLVKFGMVAG